MSHTTPYAESISGLQALAYSLKDAGSYQSEDMRRIENAIADLKFAQDQERNFKIASRDARLSLAQEIAATLKKRGYWIPEDVASSDLISAVGQALTPTANLIELRDLVQGAFAVVNAMAQAEPGDDFMALKPECEKLNERYNALPEINKILHTKQVS